MSNYIINLYTKENQDFPVNTYSADSKESVIVCIRGLLKNKISGINRIEIVNPKFGKINNLENVGCNPQAI